MLPMIFLCFVFVVQVVEFPLHYKLSHALQIIIFVYLCQVTLHVGSPYTQTCFSMLPVTKNSIGRAMTTKLGVMQVWSISWSYHIPNKVMAQFRRLGFLLYNVLYTISFMSYKTKQTFTCSTKMRNQIFTATVMHTSLIEYR